MSTVERSARGGARWVRTDAPVFFGVLPRTSVRGRGGVLQCVAEAGNLAEKAWHVLSRVSDEACVLVPPLVGDVDVPGILDECRGHDLAGVEGWPTLASAGVWHGRDGDSTHCIGVIQVANVPRRRRRLLGPLRDGGEFNRGHALGREAPHLAQLSQRRADAEGAAIPETHPPVEVALRCPNLAESGTGVLHPVDLPENGFLGREIGIPNR